MIVNCVGRGLAYDLSRGRLLALTLTLSSESIWIGLPSDTKNYKLPTTEWVRQKSNVSNLYTKNGTC